MAVHRKEEKSVETKPEVAKTEPVVVSNVVTETIEVVEGVIPQEVESEIQADSTSPLSEFKEKMVEEEKFLSDTAPKRNYMWPILLIFIIVILLLVGVFLYKNGGINIKDKVNVATLSPTPTVVPEPTKAVDLTKYEIKIQNGGGVSGEASRQKVSLESEGFVVSSVGNADNSDYTDTIIKAKAEVEKGFLDKLKSVLENTFTLGQVEVLPEDSSVPVVVIIGTKK